MKLIINGCAGRMGATLVRLAVAHPDIALVGGFEAAGSDALNTDLGTLAGLDACGVVAGEMNSDLEADAIVDFSTPAATAALAVIAAETGTAHIIGTTGFDDATEAAIAEAARRVVVVKSGNMSLGVNLLAALVERAAEKLPDWDVSVVDLHHRHKVDAPSGTALLLGEAAGRKTDFASLRGGSVVGAHDVYLAGEGEYLVLSHRAENRDIFAQGALTAALWAQTAKAGLYSMRDVLGV